MSELGVLDEILSMEEESELYLKTACFTGHRRIYDQEGIENMKTNVDFALSVGYRTFLCGMALGFDSLAFDYVYAQKKKYKDIRLVACVPCPGQDKYFSKKESEEYHKRLSRADYTVVISEKYTEGCMLTRNRFMVDYSSCVISYFRGGKGGTGYTVKYAQSLGKMMLTA